MSTNTAARTIIGIFVGECF